MRYRFGALILAAGESRRMGRTKQLLPWGDGTVIQAVTTAALRSPVAEVVVVLGHSADAVQGAIGVAEPRLSFVTNERYQEGMLSSVWAGLAALSRACDGLFLFLGDQPLVSPKVCEALADRFAPGLILVPTYEGRRGHPALFSMAYREEIQGLDESVGLRQLLRRHPDAVREVAVADPAIHIDLDTPADYERYKGG